jgi:hypothetical protein
MTRQSCVGLLLVYLALASSARAAVLQVNGDGLLTGATGVSLNGTLYNVEFVDGPCATLFDGCDSVSDFTFTTDVDALAASTALGDQLFLDVAGVGDFDAHPSHTLGCTTNLACLTLTPYAFTDQGGLWASTFKNYGPAFTDSANFFEFINFKPDTSSLQTDLGLTGLVYARWTPADANVPEPASLTLVALGLAGAAARRHVLRSMQRRKRVTHVVPGARLRSR